MSLHTKEPKTRTPAKTGSGFLSLSDHTTPQAILAECYRVLKKANSNIVWEILRQSKDFYEWSHYPEGDVFDPETHSQYYYHTHPPGGRDIPAEHGHFHLFLREDGMPKGVKPLALPKQDDDNQSILSHLIGIAMDPEGFPLGLFTTNRWVTGEAWYSADDVCKMLDYFNIDHAWPSWPTNLWLTHMVHHYKPQIKQLIVERDKTMKAWQAKYPDRDVFEDRDLEITSYLALSDLS